MTVSDPTIGVATFHLRWSVFSELGLRCLLCACKCFCVLLYMPVCICVCVCVCVKISVFTCWGVQIHACVCLLNYTLYVCVPLKWMCVFISVQSGFFSQCYYQTCLIWSLFSEVIVLLRQYCFILYLSVLRHVGVSATLKYLLWHLLLLERGELLKWLPIFCTEIRMLCEVVKLLIHSPSERVNPFPKWQNYSVPQAVPHLCKCIMVIA